MQRPKKRQNGQENLEKQKNSNRLGSMEAKWYGARNCYRVWVPARLSETGKACRRFFETKEEAQKFIFETKRSGSVELADLAVEEKHVNGKRLSNGLNVAFYNQPHLARAASCTQAALNRRNSSKSSRSAASNASREIRFEDNKASKLDPALFSTSRRYKEGAESPIALLLAEVSMTKFARLLILCGRSPFFSRYLRGKTRRNSLALIQASAFEISMLCPVSRS